MKKKKLRPGTEVQIWPGDTYAKYGIIKKINPDYIAIELTRVHPDDYCGFKPGDIIKLPRSRAVIVTRNGKPESSL